MDTSVFLAQLLSIVYLCFGIGMLSDQKRYQKLFKEMLKNDVYMILAGVAALAGGFTIVTVHNVWAPDWKLLITVIGWASLIKGVLLLVSPAGILDLAEHYTKQHDQVGFLCLILGLVLGYFGFVA